MAFIRKLLEQTGKLARRQAIWRAKNQVGEQVSEISNKLAIERANWRASSKANELNAEGTLTFKQMRRQFGAIISFLQIRVKDMYFKLFDLNTFPLSSRVENLSLSKNSTISGKNLRFEDVFFCLQHCNFVHAAMGSLHLSF